jgi:hypothetical protein
MSQSVSEMAIVRQPPWTALTISPTFGKRSMKNNKARFNERENVPKLIPTGSLNKVLLVGGKNLTLFQSLWLIVFGLLVAIGFGISFVSLAKEGDWSGSIYLLLLFGAMTFWGNVMIVNGVLGIAARLHASKHSVRES